MTARSSTRSVDSVLRIAGNLQFGNDLTILRNGIQDRLDQGERDIVLELSQVERVDSAGIGELVYAFNQVAAVGGRLLVLNPPAKVEMLFQVAGLAKSLRRGVIPTRSEHQVECSTVAGEKFVIWEGSSKVSRAGSGNANMSAPVQDRETPRPPLGASLVSQLLTRSIRPGPSPSSKASTWRPYLGRLMWS